MVDPVLDPWLLSSVGAPLPRQGESSLCSAKPNTHPRVARAGARLTVFNWGLAPW